MDDYKKSQNAPCNTQCLFIEYIFWSAIFPTTYENYMSIFYAPTSVIMELRKPVLGRQMSILLYYQTYMYPSFCGSVIQFLREATDHWSYCPFHLVLSLNFWDILFIFILNEFILAHPYQRFRRFNSVTNFHLDPTTGHIFLQWGLWAKSANFFTMGVNWENLYWGQGHQSRSKVKYWFKI